jgi:hypothetical protein
MMRRILGPLVTLALFGLLVRRERLAASTGGRLRGEPMLIGALVGTATERWLLSYSTRQSGCCSRHVDTRGLPVDATWERIDDSSLLLCMRCRVPLAVLSHPLDSSPADIEELWEEHLADVLQLAREHRCLGQRGLHEEM